jgi:uncharacterized protein (DUF1778 family)
MSRSKVRVRQIADEGEPRVAASSDARLSFRVPASAKALIERAALYSGETLTSYAVSRLVREARQEIHEHEVLMLSTEARDAFLAALDNPPEPTQALLDAVTEYREHVVPRQQA